MAKQTVNIGNNANDGSGDPARSAFTKINQNFDELYNLDNNQGIRSIAGGGTGASDQSTARKNLGAAFGGAENDTTDLNDIADNSVRFVYNPNAKNTAVSGSWTHLICTSSMDKLGSSRRMQITSGDNYLQANLFFRKSIDNVWSGWWKLYSSGNTTVDGNGYLKPSSPVVRLYADKIELINEAAGQPITFEKIGVGNYLVKNTTGLRNDDGWYIETPKDLNGNILVFVEYTQLDNKDISVKTYKKKFDIDTASIVADHDNPMDIPQDRWIDLRFNDYPVPEQQPTPEAIS